MRLKTGIILIASALTVCTAFAAKMETKTAVGRKTLKGDGTMLGDISSVVTLICRPGKITLPAEFTGKAPEGFFPVVFSFEPDDDSLTCRIQCDDASFVKCRYVPSIYGSFTGAVKLVLKDGSSLPVFREIQRLRAEGSAEVLAECNGYPAAVRNHFGNGTTELWGTCLTMNFGADLSKIIPDFAEKNGVNIPVRIKSGKNLIASCCRGGNALLAVFFLADKRITADHSGSAGHFRGNSDSGGCFMVQWRTCFENRTIRNNSSYYQHKCLNKQLKKRMNKRRYPVCGASSRRMSR